MSQSQQLENAVPPSTIASLSTGEFVGIVADDAHQVIPQKIFHGNLQPYVETRSLTSYYNHQYEKVLTEDLEKDFSQIKNEARTIVRVTMERMINTPGLVNLIVRK